MNRIAEVLKEKGIKQIWLAEKLNKSFNMVNGYVRNRRQPSMKILFEIAKILEVEPYTLITHNKVANENDSAYSANMLREHLLSFIGWLHGDFDKKNAEKIVDDYLNSK